MTPEQKAAFVMAQAACAMAEVMSRFTVNQAEIAAGNPPPYKAADFDSIFERYLISYNQVCKFFET